MRKNNINKKIEEALESFDGAERAEPTPFLFTRIMARMQSAKENSWERVSRLITRPSFAVAGLGFVLLINVLVISFNSTSSQTTSGDQFTLGTPSDFSTSVASIYEIDTNN
jgi:hypothetical protein